MNPVKRRDLLSAAFALAATSALAQQPLGPPQVLAPPPPPPPPLTPEEIGKTVKVDMVTREGPIVIELYVERAPITANNFLRLVDQKRFDGSTFYRASRTPGAPQFGVVQGGVVFDGNRPVRGIAHEPSSQTRILHRDGVISMGRLAPGTATSDFFICVGDASYLDADPSKPGDNLGYAAFGRVVEGMDVVRKILALPTDGRASNPAMQGQILSPPVPIVSAKRAPGAG